jgi:hypothetical protein
MVPPKVIIGWCRNLTILAWNRVERCSVISTNGHPPVHVRIACSLDQMLAHELSMVLLCTAVTGPLGNICEVSGPVDFGGLESVPGTFECSLLVCWQRSMSSADIAHVHGDLVPVRCKCLCDESMCCKVNWRTIVQVKDQSLEVTPQCLDHHCCPSSRQRVTLRRPCP